MTTQSNTSIFMTDFAARDSRSALAHIEGRNLRVTPYRTFGSAVSLVGRREQAVADYHKLTQFLFRNQPVVRQKFAQARGFLVAAVDLVSK